MDDAVRACMPNADWLAFIIGDVGHRVSIHTQQLRALNLVKKLHESHRQFDSAESVAVIGGGVAGLTLAVALRAIGKNVRVFERKRRLVPLQWYSRTRYIHPTAINWPHIELSPCTNLPFLNWNCDFGERIANQIYTSFRDRESSTDKSLTSLTCCEVTSVKREIVSGESSFIVEYSRLDHLKRSSDPLKERFSAVFFACGFGQEEKIDGYDNFSYWEDVNVRPIKSSLNPPNIAIIGDGDGALIDLFRCFWRNRLFDKVFRSLVNEHVRSGCAQDIRAFDNQIITGADIAGGDPARRQKDIYSEALKSESANDFLSDSMEFDSAVTIYSPQTFPFSVQSSPLHKVLLSYLLNHDSDLVKHSQGRVEEIRYSLKDKCYFVRMKGEVSFRKEQHDRVLVRIGPNKKRNSLITDLFDEDVLKSFDLILNNKYEFANPTPRISADLRAFYFDIAPHLINGYYTEAQSTLANYLLRSLDIQKVHISMINKPRSANGAQIFVVRVDGTPANIESVSNLKKWMGMDIVVKRGKITQTNLP